MNDADHSSLKILAAEPYDLHSDNANVIVETADDGVDAILPN